MYKMDDVEKSILEDCGMRVSKMEKKVNEILHDLIKLNFTVDEAANVLRMARDVILKTADWHEHKTKLADIGIE